MGPAGRAQKAEATLPSAGCVPAQWALLQVVPGARHTSQPLSQGHPPGVVYDPHVGMSSESCLPGELGIGRVSECGQ